MKNLSRGFRIDELNKEIIWSIEACVRVLLKHPEISGEQIRILGKLISALEQEDWVIVEDYLKTGLVLKRQGTRLAGGSFIEVQANPERLEISSGWWENDPDHGSEHRTTILCECEASGFTEVADDLPLLPQEFEKMIEEGAEIIVESYEE